jgi:hypothetical protein
LLPFNVLTRDRDARAVQAEIAQLPGVRFVRASELRENVYLDEGRIKAWTGGDPVSCAHKFGRPFKSWAEAEHLSERERPGRRTLGEWLSERFERHEDRTGRFHRVRVVEGGGLHPRSGTFSHTRACEKGFQKASASSTLHPPERPT